MAIKQFNFPGVTLTQEFVASNVGNQTVLSVACIGRPYYLHRADVASEAAYINYTYKTTGNTAQDVPGRTQEVLIAGGTPTTAAIVTGDTASQLLAVEDGLFEHVTVSSGFSVSSTGRTTKKMTIKCGIVVKSGNGKDAAASFGNTEAAVGDKVNVYITGDTVGTLGTITNITNESTDSGFNQITVTFDGAGTVSTSATVTSFKFLIKTDWSWKGATGMTLHAETGKVTLEDGLEAEKLDGTHDCALFPATYKFYIQYREVNSIFNGVLGSVYNQDAVDEVLGAPCMENPLALAVKMAALAAPDTIVYFTGIASETTEAFNEALDFLANYEEVYSIVPVIVAPASGYTRSAIIASLLNDVIASSDDEESKIRRSLWYGLEPQSDSETSADWKSKDTSNTSRSEMLKSMKDAIPASFRAQAVWADGAQYNGEDIDNCFVAAAAAGMRSAQPCHRPLSNLGYDFFTVADGHGFTKSQLKFIGSQGIWIVGSNRDGVATNLRQVTSAEANDINQDEESIVANIDEICLSLCHIGEDSVGCSNISKTMIMALSDDITILMDSKLINQTGSAYIGAQLLSWTLDKIYQDPIHKDRIYAVISCEPPKPFNEFKITLRVI